MCACRPVFTLSTSFPGIEAGENGREAELPLLQQWQWQWRLQSLRRNRRLQRRLQRHQKQHLHGGGCHACGKSNSNTRKAKQPQANRAKQGLPQEHSNTKDGREDKHRARCNHTQRCECEQQKIKVTIDGSNKPLQRDYSNRHGSFNHLQGDYNN